MKMIHFHPNRQEDYDKIKNNEQTKPNFKKSLTKILEAIYIQKIKETNDDYLSYLNFNEILNLPSLVSESLFNALVTEPRNYIKLDEFVDGLSILFDKNIDFDLNEKTNVPKIYEILYKIFCLRIKKIIANGDSKPLSSKADNLNNTNLSVGTENSDANCFYFHYDLEHFNKIISNILLVYYLKGDNLNIEEFLPFCEEIKLIVKKTFNRNSNINNSYMQDSNLINFTNISNIKTNNNNNNFFHNFKTNGSTNNYNAINSFQMNSKDFSSFNLNMNNINPSFNNGSNLNLNLKMNLDDISTISDNNLNSYLNITNYPLNARNSPKDFISLEEFIECLQRNSKLLFILLLLFYSLSPINQKLIYLLMKHPETKLISDADEDVGDFIEEDEATEDIQVLPLSNKKMNLGEIKNDSKSNSSINNLNSSNDDSKETLNYNRTESMGNLITKVNSIREANQLQSKINSENKNRFNSEPSNTQAKIVFDLSENSDTFSHSYTDLNNEASGIRNIRTDKSNENFNDSSKTISVNGGSPINLNNYTNKSKFYKKNSLFDKEHATAVCHNDKYEAKNIKSNYANDNFTKNKNENDLKLKQKANVINFNLDDSDSFNNTNSFKAKNNSDNKNLSNSNLVNTKSQLENKDSESKIIIYRHDKTNESSLLTNNDRIFDSRFRNSFERIIICNKDENQEDNMSGNIFDKFKKVNDANSLYNDYDELLIANKKTNDANKRFNIAGCRSLPSRISTLELNDNPKFFKDKDNLLEDTHSVNINNDKSLVSNNPNNYNKIKGNNYANNNSNNPFAFEEVFSEYKVSVEKVKISRDFIFNSKKCQEFNYQSNCNKNLSFKNFNFNVEDDWLIKNLKDNYVNIINKNLSEIKKFNKHLSFLTIFYQFNESSEVNQNKNNKGNLETFNDKNCNINNKENLIKHKSKNLSKSVADIIDDYLVLFSFNNAFQANMIQNLIQTNKEKVLGKVKSLESNGKNNNNNNNKTSNYCRNENEVGLADKVNFNKSNVNSNQEGYYGFSDKTTNYKDSTSKLSIKNYLVSSKDAENFKCKENINFLDNLGSEENSEVFSLMDIYESNNFYSLNLKLIVNLRNCKIASHEETTVNGIKLYPITLKQEENLYVLFFETEFEKDILLTYHKEQLLNSNPIKDYLIGDVISKNKYLEYAKARHKETKEIVEVKKYTKTKIINTKIIKEINSIRDLSMVYKFFSESKIPKILYFENADEIFIVNENDENDPIKFIFMNPELKITKDVSKYSLNIKKMKELKSMLEILSISLVPKVNVE